MNRGILNFKNSFHRLLKDNSFALRSFMIFAKEELIIVTRHFQPELQQLFSSKLCPSRTLYIGNIDGAFTHHLTGEQTQANEQGPNARLLLVEGSCLFLADSSSWVDSAQFQRYVQSGSDSAQHLEVVGSTLQSLVLVF
jgi:hypothetical protein